MFFILHDIKFISGILFWILSQIIDRLKWALDKNEYAQRNFISIKLTVLLDNFLVISFYIFKLTLKDFATKYKSLYNYTCHIFNVCTWLHVWYIKNNNKLPFRENRILEKKKQPINIIDGSDEHKEKVQFKCIRRMLHVFVQNTKILGM